MKRGRPKQFDDNEVLALAMQVFWRQGYEATSLDDLVEAMGIPRQSLYRTFTDKRTLFLKSLHYYDKNVMDPVLETLKAEGPAINNLRNLFEIWRRSVSAPERMGCLLVNTASQVASDDKEVIKLLQASQRRGVKAFESAVRRAQSEGDVATSINPTAVSRTIGTIVHGLLGMSRSGMSAPFRDDVLATIPALLGID